MYEPPVRSGDRPTTQRVMPHQQLDQTAPVELQEQLCDRCRGLPGVYVGPSHVSVPGARAFHLDPDLAGGAPEAFMRGTEFAHLHPAYDGSLHLALPVELARSVIGAGWGEHHPLVEQGVMPATQLMVYGPRDAGELEVVWSIVEQSYAFARGGAGNLPLN
jgi:luciferase-like monooxygenase